MNIGLGIWIGNPPAYVTGGWRTANYSKKTPTRSYRKTGSDLLVEA